MVEHSGVLGRLGQTALKRGFAKTHFFAQARLVFAVAAHRCREIYDPPRAMTLWNLPAEVEDRFESRWADCVERAEEWSSFFTELQTPRSDDLLEDATRLGLADDQTLKEVRQLRRAAENRTVPIPGEHRPNDRILTLLALGFFRGEPGAGNPLRTTGGLIAMRRAASTEISTFTLIKGSLIPETYAAFRDWNFSATDDENLAHIKRATRSAPGALTGSST